MEETPPTSHNKRKAVLVEMIGDFSSPWCWVGKRRLDNFIRTSRCKRRFDVQVRSLPFLLDPSLLPAEELKCLRCPPSTPSPFSNELLRTATKVGFDLSDFRQANLARLASTVQGHCLLKYAEMELGLAAQNELAEMLYSSFLGTGSYPTLDLLIEYAKRVGMDATKTRMFLETRREEILVRVEAEQYAKRGVKQLPFFVLNGKAVFAGCQDFETILDAFEICPHIG
jgi:predicted DsbA family dithiol-disulfide isomerase